MHRKHTNPRHLNPFMSRAKRWFKDGDADPANGGGGGGGGVPDKAAADKAAADAKAAADKASADATAAKAAADKASADQKAALDKTAKDAQDAADKAKKAADDAKATADKIAADLKSEADRKAAEKKAADEADPEDGAELTIKTKDLKGIKSRAGDKALKDKAKELGFDSVEAMEKAARALNPAASQTDTKLAELEARQQHLADELHRTKLGAAVREASLKAGFTDPAYAEFLAQQQVAGKTQAEALVFDFTGYFNGLKTSHAHLFTAVQVPANTGHPGSPAPKAPGADQAKKDAADAGKKDAHALNPAEFQSAVQRLYPT